MLAEATPVRLTQEAKLALDLLSKQTKVNKSTLLRLALAAGLPILHKQFGISGVKKSGA